MVPTKALIALLPFVALVAGQTSTADDHSQDNSIAKDITNGGAYVGGCGSAAYKRSGDNHFAGSNGGGSVQGVSMKCSRDEHLEADLERRDIEAGFDAVDHLRARQTSTSDDHSQDNSHSNTITNGLSGADIMALFGGYGGGAAPQRRQTSTSDDHSQDNSQSNTISNGLSGADIMALFGGYGGGAAPQRRQTSSSDDHSQDNSQSNTITNGLSSNDIMALFAGGAGGSSTGMPQRRGNPTSTSDDHSQDNSQAWDVTNQGGYVGGCRRSDFGLQERDNYFGSSNGGGSVQGVSMSCKRSTQLALRDVGATYRRYQARSLATEEEAQEAEDMLRRHAEHLELI